MKLVLMLYLCSFLFQALYSRFAEWFHDLQQKGVEGKRGFESLVYTLCQCQEPGHPRWGYTQYKTEKLNNFTVTWTARLFFLSAITCWYYLALKNKTGNPFIWRGKKSEDYSCWGNEYSVLAGDSFIHKKLSQALAPPAHLSCRHLHVRSVSVQADTSFSPDNQCCRRGPQRAQQ